MIPTVSMLVYIVVSSLFSRQILAREGLGSACSISNNHLEADTKEFITDCDSFGYCSAEGLCKPRGCRRDEFVLTSLLKINSTTSPIPDLCPSGSFCPDDASSCLPLVEVGGRCQLNRDDECAPPPGREVTDPNDPWSNPYTGSVCLLGTCQWGNITIGQKCIYESTTYVGYDVSGASFTNIVTRDNCVEGQGYCDIPSSTCLPLKVLNDACETDRECQTLNCDTSGHCAVPPEAAVRVAKWVYALVSLGLVFAMAGIIALLILMHRRALAAQRIKLEDYYREQTAYRNSIISFHSALAGRSTDKLDNLSRKGSNNTSAAEWERQKLMRSLSNLSDTTVVDRH